MKKEFENKLTKRVICFLLSLLMTIGVLPMNTLTTLAVSNEQIIYNYLTNTMGLNSAAACGVLANIEKESSFRPTASGDSGTSYGICQWHASRKTRLIEYCNKNNYDYKTLTGQLNYLNYELQKGYKSTLNYLKGVSNNKQGAYDAGYYWCFNFEKPSNKANKSVQRGKLAQNTYWEKYGSESGTQTINNSSKCAIFPLRDISVSQKHNAGTHKETMNVDFEKKLNLYAPFDCKVVYVNKAWNYGNQVIIQSIEKVYFANGDYDYMTVSVSHDNDISDIKNGKEFKQGEIFYRTGNYGNVTGVHVHLGVAKGKYSGQFKNSDGYLGLKNNILPSDAFFITNDTKISKSGGYNWIKITDIKPATPEVNVSRSGNVPQNTAITISWSKVRYADGYRVYCNNDKIYDGKNSSVTYKLDVATTYSINVEAYNTKYTSNKSRTHTVTAKAPLNVTFKDWNGNIIGGKQSVIYGKNAIAPSIPTRIGYKFAGWDKSLNNIVADTVITAKYEINKYTVKFVDHDNSVLKTQTVNYGGDATPPTVTPPSGYEFVGWNSQKYNKVESDVTVKATYKWANEDLPIITTITSAARQKDGYTVKFDLKNYNIKDTVGRAVITVKTAEGKLIETTESAAFSIAKGATKTGMEVFVPCSDPASVVEVIIVSNYSTGVPISKSVTSKINLNNTWSSWVDKEPDYSIAGIQVESRKIYRYRDKLFSTSSSSTKSGWTKYNETWQWSSYGSWSPWSTTAYKKSDYREVQTGTDVVSEGYYQYRYFGWKNGAGKIHFCPVAAKAYWGGSWSAYNSGWVTKNVSGTSLGQVHGYSNCSCGMAKGEKAYLYEYNNKNYCRKESRYIQPVTQTIYRYRDRSKLYTYYFWRWDNWSSWGTEYIQETSNRDVETATQYRSLVNAGTAVEDVSGKLRTASTNASSLHEDDVLLPLLKEFAGKQVTLFIHKYNEASDWTDEFVGQTTINSDGSYSFNFKLREEPSETTGDFTVAIGVEGTTDIMVVDTIEAPKQKYTVVFRNWDGSILDTQTVIEGDTAVLPDDYLKDELTREGYKFVGWSGSTVNINCDTELEALYVINTYSVVFVDWFLQNIVIKEFEHGEIIVPPEVNPIEGYTFLGWSDLDDGETIATENVVLSAEYEKQTFVVKFYDYDSNVISEEIVEYGDDPIVPLPPVKENYEFNGWVESSNEDMSCISTELHIYPEFKFKETVDIPVANIRTGTYTENQHIELSCATQNSVIYYTTDGTDPAVSVTAKLYEGPIELTRSTELKFIASAFEKNNSAVVRELYAINTDNTTSKWMTYAELPEFVLDNPSVYEIQNDIGYKYKDITVTSSASELVRLESEGWTIDGFEYGPQSEWSLTYPELDDTLYEVIEQKPPLVDEIHYEYSHFKYYDSAAGKYVYAPEAVEGYEGTVETYVSPTRLSVAGFISGTTTPYYNYNGETWFNQKAVVVSVDPGYMMYAYKLKNYTLSKWTEWTTEAPTSDETRETQSDTVYCYTVPEMCIVTFTDDFEETEDIKVLGVVGQTISIPENLANIGYTVDGLYTDAGFENEWNTADDTLTGDVTLFSKQTINTYTVKFVGFNGEVISTQTVEHGSEATPPEVNVPDDYVFIDWDNEDYMSVTSDLVVNAVIKLESEIVTLTLSKDKFTTMAGSSFTLTATVESGTLDDDTVIWSSSDYSVADVDENGVVTTFASGTVTITATVSDGTSATCVVTVLADPDSALTLRSSSDLVIDSSGYLRNIPIIIDEYMSTHTAATVAEIKTHFINDSIVVVNMNGETLSDEDSIGTGSVIKLMNGETTIDTITVVVTGDFDGNGSINNRDASRITRYLVDKEEANLYQMVAIDVNGDGYVNNRDASMVSRYLVGKEKF